ncbi:AEC family transporter [Mesorhizobium microcysteis]|uniref:AEC family transporter n=1 Tax=Neoaquamicrobium microcysteis TaxID=2682781 RepID=A0A5D4GZF7_9HYPH|nr:AEC family transporter [Mesorhizobium microcysteis]TYR33778.1 AEC family transporter [Mesorhizobium microcysteis]
MLVILESILPIFLLIAAGMVLRRLPIINDAAWPGMEQLSYWFLYPSLLFVTIYNADFSGLRLDAMLAALLTGVAVMAVLMLALWPVLRGTGLVAASEYSSVFQTSIRWNGFIALPVATKIFPPEGAAVVALAMAVIIVPINVLVIFVVMRFANRQASLGRTLLQVALNPLVLAVCLGVILRLTPFGLYEPVNETLRLVGNAALGLGLMAIGASLRPGDLVGMRFAIWLPVVMKLAVFPVVLVGLAMLFGLRGEPVLYLALCAAVPTAMNGYLLARQLGGDAELYAAVTTLQTAVSFFSIPLVLALAAQVSSG